MKTRILWVLSVLCVASTWIISCSNNTPATPSNPTATPTVCTDGSGHTCTPTFTSSPTNTGTPTDTATVTDTPTVTRTPTITSTPTDTLSPTPTGSATATFTRTSTATLSPTITYSPTPNCTGSYSISGSVSFNGTPTPGDILYVVASTGFGNTNPCNSSFGQVTTNPGSYAISFLPAGSYYVASLYGSVPSNGGPPLGTDGGFYDGGSGVTCSYLNSTQVNLSSGSQSGVNLAFDNTYQIWGVTATVNYSGSETGGSLNLGVYTDNTYSTQINGNGGMSTGSTTHIDDATQSCSLSGATVYVMAWYGNNSSGPKTGDDYFQYGPTTEVNNPTSKITVNVGTNPHP